MKRRANRADFETNFDLVGFILRNDVAPRQQQDFAMLSYLGALMQRKVAAVRKQLLPPAFVVVQVRAGGTRTRWLEVRAFAKTRPCAPHEVDIARFVKKLVDIRAFIGNDRHAKLFVFERDTSMAFQRQFGDPASVVAIM